MGLVLDLLPGDGVDRLRNVDQRRVGLGRRRRGDGQVTFGIADYQNRALVLIFRFGGNRDARDGDERRREQQQILHETPL